MNGVYTPLHLAVDRFKANPASCKFCALGAIGITVALNESDAGHDLNGMVWNPEMSNRESPAITAHINAVEYLSRAAKYLKFSDVVEFNDSSRTTVADVHKMFDIAIHIAEKESENENV